MSRIGKSIITVPSGVDVTISGQTIKVKGPKGELTHQMHEGLSAELDDGILSVSRSTDVTSLRALHGLNRSLINNMVIGVSQGFIKKLEIVGVGYRAAANGDNKLDMALGFSHPVQVTAPAGVTFEVPEPTRISVIGIDKQAVGQVAAEIRALRKPEPYKGKGVRYAGEKVVRKAGKAGK